MDRDTPSGRRGHPRHVDDVAAEELEPRSAVNTDATPT
jgi:hypothetical protein